MHEITIDVGDTVVTQILKLIPQAMVEPHRNYLEWVTLNSLKRVFHMELYISVCS